jgi:hypothetical protein
MDFIFDGTPKYKKQENFSFRGDGCNSGKKRWRGERNHLQKFINTSFQKACLELLHLESPYIYNVIQVFKKRFFQLLTTISSFPVMWKGTTDFILGAVHLTPTSNINQVDVTAKKIDEKT